jgi:hypothetical protein
MRVQGLLLAIAGMPVACLPMFAPIAACEPGKETAKNVIRESFRFDPDAGAILIPVRVGGQARLFDLDTGCAGSAFDISLRSHLGARVKSTVVEAPNGDKKVLALYAPPKAWIGSLPLTKDPVACDDLALLREASGCAIYGLLGMDFLKHWIIVIDFDEGRLDILSPAAPRDPKWGECLPFLYDRGGTMCIMATVGKNFRVLFKLDTGETGTGSLDSAFLAGLIELQQARITGDTEAVVLSGTRTFPVARLSHLSVASFRHENLRFTSSRTSSLGLSYLSRYRVTIDFPNERLYLAKGKRFAVADRGHTCGVRFAFKPGRIEVVSVDEKGAAHAAGLRAKDSIVALDGKPVSQWKTSEIHRLFGEESKPIQITIERDGKRSVVNLTPKEYD